MAVSLHANAAADERSPYDSSGAISDGTELSGSLHAKIPAVALAGDDQEKRRKWSRAHRRPQAGPFLKSESALRTVGHQDFDNSLVGVATFVN